MLNKDLKDIQLNLHQLDSSINSVLEFIRNNKNRNASSDNNDIQNAFLVIESAIQKVLWKKEEVEKAKAEFKKQLG